MNDTSTHPDTLGPVPGTEPSHDDADPRRRLAEQVADRIQRELAGDMELLRARLRLAQNPAAQEDPAA